VTVAALKGRLGWSMLFVVAAACVAVAGVRAAATPTDAERVEEISKVLACPICDGESVFESRNGASAAIRNEIRSQIDLGRSDDEIVAYLQQRSDVDLTLVPDAEGISLSVWAIPVVTVVACTVGLGFAFRRWKTMQDAVPTDDDEALVAAALRETVDE
jgi:cytochrome c-type biogenesis protein CcmH